MLLRYHWRMGGKPYLPGRPLRTANTVRTQSAVLWFSIFFVGGAALRIAGVPLGSWYWIVAIGLPFAFTAYQRSEIRRYNAANRDAHSALKQGDAATAEREFAVNRDRFRSPRFLRRLSDYNLAQAKLRMGKLREANELLAECDRKGGVINVDPAIASTLSYTHALLGELDLADRWLAEAKRRYARFAQVPAFPSILTEVAIDLRRGRAAEVKTRLDNDWRQIESSLTGERMRPLRVFRAFAVAQASDPREAGAVAPILATLHPATADEFAYLGAAWPELASFLATSFPV